jgi:short-subunit dehydrogenase
MKKSVIIIGAGSGLSTGIAKRFANEDFQIGLISRNKESLQRQADEFSKMGFPVYYEPADATNEEDLEKAINSLRDKLGGVDVLVYNAAAIRQKNILNETAVTLVNDFKVNVANVLSSVKVLLSELKEKKGAVLLTGGGFSLFPHPEFGSLSIGKAGLRSLAFQLNQTLSSAGIFIGTVTINGVIDEQSELYTPTLIAEKFWQLYQQRTEVEIQY